MQLGALRRCRICERLTMSMPVTMLGHRVLDLDARVDLDEEPLLALRIDQELDGAGIDVVSGLGELDGGLAELAAGLVGQVRRRGDLDDFLVAALHGAVALPQVHDVAVGIGKDLHLDVARLADEALDEHSAIAEGEQRFLLRLFDLGRQVGFVGDDAHAAPAAAEGRLDDHRQANLFRCLQRFGGVFETGSFVPGTMRTPASTASLRAAILSPSNSSSRGLGPTKVMPACAQASAKSRFSERKP